MAGEPGIDRSAKRRPDARPARAARRGVGLVRDERGVSMLEFGLFFPILALMVLGTIDLARGLANKFAIEQAAQRAIEMATLGGRPRGDYTYLQTEAAAAAGVPVDNVVVSKWLECDGVSADYFSSCTSTQQTARYVSVSIYKDYTPMFEWMPFLGRVSRRTDGKIRLTADSGVRVQ